MKIIALVSMVFIIGCSTSKQATPSVFTKKIDSSNFKNVFFLNKIDTNSDNLTNLYEDARNCINDSTGFKNEFVEHNKTRPVVKRNAEKLPMTDSGKHIIKTCIDKSGNVVSASLLESPGNSRRFKEQLLEAAIGYKYQADFINSPCIQCGTLTVVMDINKFRK